MNTDSFSDRYISLALQGNIEPALSLFEGIDPEAGSQPDVELAERFRVRFIEQSEDLSPQSGDPLVDQLVSTYRRYWALTLMGRLSAEQARSFLENALHGVLSTVPGPAPSDQSLDVFERTGAALNDRGFHYLEADAPPLRDLFLWRSEENKRYSVRLTDRTQNVQVTLMDGLVSLGWKEFATLGLVSTTGWVEDGRLYCVEWAYDRNSENFRVSYLKHESRHLADLERFPALPSVELEYRAKLTELVFASTSIHRLLNDFTNKSALNPVSPHAWANYRVTRDLYQELYAQPFPESANPWRQVDTHAVSPAARRLLQRNTKVLQAGSP